MTDTDSVMDDAGEAKPPNLRQLRLLAVAQRQAWADEVRTAMAEKHLPLYRVAQSIGISPGTLQGWLERDVDPDPRAMHALGKAIGRDPLRLMQIVGYLPERVADEGLYLTAACEIRAAVDRAADLLETARDLAAKLDLLSPTQD